MGSFAIVFVFLRMENLHKESIKKRCDVHLNLMIFCRILVVNRDAVLIYLYISVYVEVIKHYMEIEELLASHTDDNNRSF